ncbi:hypothetical protein MTR67_043580 [Solanum verrucosum]|uniref:Integrase zinc-binding domain-containing protein n=1 Tax=Solanum verrucosum TaxID=315347 RepID=A0AAF0ZUV0_SOLVR|nr:hypothetical protein MTR67_043580 [Solanum verrucosum]
MVHSSESSFVMDVKSKQGLDPILVELKMVVLKKSIEAFSEKGEGVLRYEGLLCLPNVGVTKMYLDLWEVYWWNDMNKDIAEFMAKCPNCQQVKVENQSVIVDRMTKYVHFIPDNISYSTEDYAKLYIREMVKFHGVQLSIISHPGPQFNSQFWRNFQNGLRIKYIRNRVRTTQSQQKSYADVRRRDLEFEVNDWVYYKISPMKGVMTFGKKGKLSPRYVGP